MIVVIGRPVLQPVATQGAAGGMAARIALAAAARGAQVQLVGKVGDDPEGEAVVLDLARGGVGHVALLRDAARRTPVLSGESPAEDAPTAAALAEDDATASDGLAVEAPVLETADLELGLRYLTEFRVVVAAEPLDEASARVVAAAADWTAATTIAVVPASDAVPAALPETAIVLQAPAGDPDGVFASLVGGLAARIDAGADPRDAFRELVETAGWEPVGA